MPDAFDQTKSWLERSWRSASLRTYLVAVILLATFPIAAVMLVQILRDVHQDQAAVETALMRATASLAQALESEFAGSFDALGALAHGDQAQLLRDLQSRPRPRRSWDSVFLMDRAGAIVFDTAATPTPPPTLVLDLRQRILERAKPAATGLIDGPTAHVVLAVPTVANGAAGSMLGARVGVGVWQRLAQGANPPAGGIASLHGPDLRVVSASRDGMVASAASLSTAAVEAMREQPAGIQRLANGDSGAMYTAWRLSPATGWTVSVALPATPIEAAHRQAIVAALSTSAASLLLGVVLAALAARQLTRPLHRLEAKAQEFALEVETASRAKDEFITMLSHELRNPLGAIAAAVDVLDSAEPQGETAAEARAIIARQTRDLSHMMNDLLDVSRVIAGKILLSRQPVDLADIAQRVQQTLTLTGAAAHHRLRCTLHPAWVDGDAVRLEQILGNLLTNALKYTPPGGDIGLSVRREGRTALIEVQDCGEGIPGALLPHIFDLFVQGERSLDRRAGGLGIGLTLVRRLVELHGGTVSVETSAAGSRFTVRLPAVEGVPALADDSLPLQLRRKVLVVEDNPDVLAALRSKLELDGHTVSTAADGIEGLDRLLKLRPEVAIVDMGLPGITGFELARRARAAGHSGRMIAISSDGHERDRANAMLAGFDAYLVKPVDRMQLRATLSE